MCVMQVTFDMDNLTVDNATDMLWNLAGVGLSVWNLAGVGLKLSSLAGVWVVRCGPCRLWDLAGLGGRVWKWACASRCSAAQASLCGLMWTLLVYGHNYAIIALCHSVRCVTAIHVLCLPSPTRLHAVLLCS